MEAPMPRHASLTRRAVGAAAALALSLTALAACSPDVPAPTEPPATSATPTPDAPSPTPTPEPEPEPTPESEPVVLSAAGVGSVAMGTASPQAALEALLGPAEQEWNDLECGPGDVDAFQWGALSVSTLEGALWGWDIQPRRGALPANVVVESGVTPVQPLSDALALPGATGPDYMANLDMLYVEAGGVSYFGQGSDATTSTIDLVGVNVVVCG
jgi:hypothetical protein